MARSGSGSQFALCRAGHQLKTSRRCACTRAEEGPGETPADVSEAGTRASQARSYKGYANTWFSSAFVSCLTVPFLHSGSVEVMWHEKVGGRCVLLPLACDGNWKRWRALPLL